MLYPIAVLYGGVEVYVDLIGSEVSRSIALQPQLIGLAKEVLANKKLSGQQVCIEQDMGRNVGYDFVVPTKDSDTIFYAKIVHDDAYTRFVKNGLPLATRYVAITLKNVGNRIYELHSVRIGRAIPPRPDTKDAVAEGRHYWENHAFIHESERLQMQTLTKICPY